MCQHAEAREGLHMWIHLFFMSPITTWMQPESLSVCRETGVTAGCWWNTALALNWTKSHLGQRSETSHIQVRGGGGVYTQTYCSSDGFLRWQTSLFLGGGGYNCWESWLRKTAWIPLWLHSQHHSLVSECALSSNCSYMTFRPSIFNVL